MAAAAWEYTIEARGDHIHVHQRGGFSTQAQVVTFQRDLERALVEADTSCALFDNRETDAVPEELRALMWSWLSQTPALDRAALLLNSVRVSRRTNRTAERNRVRVQAFDDIEAALAWLREGS